MWESTGIQRTLANKKDNSTRREGVPYQKIDQTLEASIPCVLGCNFKGYTICT